MTVPKKILFQILLPNKKDTIGRYREMDTVKNYATAAAESTQGISFTWILVGVLLGCIAGLVTYFIVGRADTRPIRETFLSMPVKGASGVACGQMSSEAEALYSLFASRSLAVGDEGSSDLRDLKNLLSKMCCMKRDLMNESEAQNAENLFKTFWADAYNVAQTTCIGGVPTGAFSVGGRDPAPRTPEPVKDLQEYDGPGARY